MGIELLNVDKPVKFIPKNQPGSTKPFTIWIRPLEWMDMLEGQDLYQQTGTDAKGHPIVNIETANRERWYKYIAERITKMTNEGKAMKVTPDTIRRLPPLIGLELVMKVFSMTQGVKPKQTKK